MPQHCCFQWSVLFLFPLVAVAGWALSSENLGIGAQFKIQMLESLHTDDSRQWRTDGHHAMAFDAQPRWSACSLHAMGVF